MKYAIVDDEPIAHRIIEGYCAELTHFQKLGNAYNVFEASELMRQYAIELLFLDINMPKMTGFEWLKTLTNPPKVIATTAYQEHALEGYELNVVDYLVKPFSFARFLKAINKVPSEQVKHTVQGSTVQPTTRHTQFFLKGDKKYHQIHSKDILFIEANGNYSKVYLHDEMIVCHEKISALENTLDSNQFLRVHKSFIVARDKIRLIQGNLIELDQKKIPVGQTYRKTIQKLLEG